ncbi:DUF2877 domain-containing protein [Hoeflea sp. TYP-13]|uniref:oxamate carbamoyltransferase subunit AllH family protein n=1 Tax=Hoeflea sp. TYP-13 TaxID=3230023 RepID=UPI0034C5E75C
MTHRSLAARTIGDGVTQARQCAMKTAHGAGCVVGTFSSGFYVRAAGMLFAVGGPKIPAGPLHLVLRKQPPIPPEQSIVHFALDRLWTKTCIIDLSGATRHRPSLPTPERLDTIVPTLAQLNSPDMVPRDVSHVWPEVDEALKRSDLNAARQLLEGLGGGLTPTGDDVLAGILMLTHMSDPASHVPGDMASRAATTELSRCFLDWAAVGQSIQPIYDLLDAACHMASTRKRASARAARRRFDHAVDVVASIGRSSGKGLLAGLGLAADVRSG